MLQGPVCNAVLKLLFAVNLHAAIATLGLLLVGRVRLSALSLGLACMPPPALPCLACARWALTRHPSVTLAGARTPPRERTPPEVREARESERELKELDRDIRTVFAYNLPLQGRRARPVRVLQRRGHGGGRAHHHGPQHAQVQGLRLHRVRQPGAPCQKYCNLYSWCHACEITRTQLKAGAQECCLQDTGKR